MFVYNLYQHFSVTFQFLSPFLVFLDQISVCGSIRKVLLHSHIAPFAGRREGNVPIAHSPLHLPKPRHSNCGDWINLDSQKFKLVVPR
jgi:hypothetical protein